MARFLNHSYPGRKAVLFVVEQSAVLLSALAGAAATAALVAGDGLVGGTPPLPGIVAALARGPVAAGDMAMVIVAAVAGGAMGRLPAATPWALGAAFTCATSLYVADLYDLRRAAADRRAGGRRTLAALAIAAAALFLAAVPASAEARGAALGAMLSAALAVVALRAALPAIVGPARRVLVVGTGAKAREMAWALVRDSEVRLDLAGFVPAAGEDTWAVPAHLLIDGKGGLSQAAARADADWIVVALDDERGRIPARDLVRCRIEGRVCLTTAMFHERVLRRIPVDNLRPSELAFSDGFEVSRTRRLVKRGMDVVAAGIGILLAAPLLLLAALAIKLDSRGPIFYGQERVGLHGRPYRILKLRSMRVDAESAGKAVWAKENDPRITRVGRALRKTRVDEIPQLLSVLRGEMSLVGPRPERPSFVEELTKVIPWYALREAVRPGVTGWAQLCYPYGASVEDAKAKLEYDLYYIKNGSVFLDIAILFHTVRHVLTARGAR